MPDLTFSIESAEPILYSASPQLGVKVRVHSDDPNALIHNVILHSQIQIEPTRRQYVLEEQEQLRDLFGEPARWGQTLKPMLWTNTSTVVASFQGETVAEVPIPCTFDFNVAATKYFHGLSDGDLPLNFLFSGTVFYQDAHGSLQVAPISWEREARFRLPVKTWQRLMESYYPNSAWLSLRKDVFELLYHYKTRLGIPTWEQTVERLLADVEETAQS